MKTETMPKTIQRWIDKNKDMIDEYWIERDEYISVESPYSVWLYFKAGWRNTLRDVHQIHAGRVSDFLDDARSIEPCDCDDCQSMLSDKE